MGYKYKEKKKCRKCGTERSLGAFLKCKGGNRGNVCFPCNRRTPRSSWIENWRRNKITRMGEPFCPGDYAIMKMIQGNQCAICDQSTKVKLQVDHCHDTGEARGLLCGPCNRALGLFGSDPTVIERAAAYLRAA